MGQYYTPIIRRCDFKTYYSHDYGEGLKLMEHSYVGNPFVDVVAYELFEYPGQLAWVGDYAEENDCKNEATPLFIQISNKLNDKKNPKPILDSNFKYRYIINYDKKEYIDMEEYKKLHNDDEFSLIIHPLPLLTAIGNGRGGGDYYGTNIKMVGNWACDLIMTTNDYNKASRCFNITSKLKFEEC